MAKGLLFASFDCTGAPVDEFNDWYDTEHIPERLCVPGFLNAQRWLGDENPKIAVATYDLANPDVVNGAAYQAIAGNNTTPWSKRVIAMCQRIMRYDGEQTVPGDAVSPDTADALLVASMNVDPAAEAEFNEWYNTEHLPSLAAVPGVLCARRFRSAISQRKYLATYHLASPDVSRSDAWNKAANTEWSARVRPHFRDVLILRCERYVRRP